MLGADVVVKQTVGFLCSKLQHPLGFRAEWNLDGRRDLLAEHCAAFDFLANILERQVRAGENPACEAFAFAYQAKEQVLGFDRNASELTRLIACKKENSSCSFRVPFEHLVPR